MKPDEDLNDFWPPSFLGGQETKTLKTSEKLKENTFKITQSFYSFLP